MRDFRNIIFVLIIILFLLQMILMKQDEKELSSEPVVAVSTFAIYDIVKHISEGTFKIVNILPFGVDAHSFEPTPKLMASIEESTLVIYSGAGLEPWIKKFDFKNRLIITTIDRFIHVKIR